MSGVRTKPARRKIREIGVGDLVSKITESLGVRECGGCKERKRKLNRLKVRTTR